MLARTRSRSLWRTRYQRSFWWHRINKLMMLHGQLLLAKNLLRNTIGSKQSYLTRARIATIFLILYYAGGMRETFSEHLWLIKGYPLKLLIGLNLLTIETRRGGSLCFQAMGTKR